nr:uncharacterized protein LOC109152282 [Ipomoea batatas]
MSIHPLSGPKKWPKGDKQPPLPPLYTAKVGRPRKHVSRKHVKLHCRICKQGGHSSRRCPQRRNIEPEIKAQREGKEVVDTQRQGQEVVNAQRVGQEEILIHTQPNVESET